MGMELVHLCCQPCLMGVRSLEADDNHICFSCVVSLMFNFWDSIEYQ